MQAITARMGLELTRSNFYAAIRLTDRFFGPQLRGFDVAVSFRFIPRHLPIRKDWHEDRDIEYPPVCSSECAKWGMNCASSTGSAAR